jgi:hypothetical protein
MKKLAAFHISSSKSIKLEKEDFIKAKQSTQYIELLYIFAALLNLFSLVLSCDVYFSIQILPTFTSQHKRD